MTPRCRRICKFLGDVWKVHPPESFVFLAVRRAGKWVEADFKNGSGRAAAVAEWIGGVPLRRGDLYFCPHAFEAPHRQKRHAIETRYGQVDIDDADPGDFRPRPSYLWRTSPGRHQGLWRFNRTLSPEEAETISRDLAYRFGADRNGWSITKLLRVPGSFNLKPQYDRPSVKLIEKRRRLIDPQRILDRAKPVTHVADIDVRAILRESRKLDVKGLLRKRGRDITHGKARVILGSKIVLEPNRSKAIFFLIEQLASDGFSWPEIAALVGANAHFIAKHGFNNDHALAGEISRAIARRKEKK